MKNLPKRLKSDNQGVFTLSEHAQNDLREIWAYLSENSFPAADKTVTELFRKFQLLAANSELGRKRDEFLLNLRSFPVKKYLIFYLPTESGVEIFRVLHSSRTLEELFEEFFDDLGAKE